MVADCKLLHFLKDYEKTNRELYLTLNMHLRLHLRECMEKFRQYLWILAVQLRKL